MEQLFKKLNIKPKDLNFYEIAFEHSSYTYENSLKESYERLEFLGDAVIELAISDYLYNNFSFFEGKMTKIRAKYVCEEALFTYANDLELSRYIKLGVGEEKSGGQHKKAILADTFESLMGAIYLDLGFRTAKKVILKIIVPYIKDKNKSKDFFKDYKSVLQELLQSDKRDINYLVKEEMGPAHNKEFIIQVAIDNIIYGEGKGHSKKEAEQQAAKKALDKLAN